MSRDFTWSRLGDLNPGPTHYELAATMPSGPVMGYLTGLRAGS